MVQTTLPEDWQELLEGELEKPYFQQLYDFVLEERKKYTVFPPAKEVFSALRLTPYARVKVLLLGQDPYHDHNQAHGLCFSVRPGITPPPSLRNIFKELHADLGWETFTDAIIRRVNEKSEPVVFVLWGGYARKKKGLIDASRHYIVESAHPSPLSARQFFGSRPFSKINQALRDSGKEEINWQLPDM